MKKFLLALVFCLLVIQSAFSQYVKNEKELLGLKGNVRTIMQETAGIVYDSGKYVEKNRYKRRTATYDLEGNLIKEDPEPPSEAPAIGCGDSDKCRWEVPERKLVHNDRDKVIEEINIYKDGTIASKREFDYDSRGKLLEWRYYHSNPASGKLELNGKVVYLRKGNTTKATHYDGCCTMINWTTAVFNKHGDHIEISGYRIDSGYSYKSAYSYEYDSKGNWTKQTTSSRVTKNGKSFFEPYEVNYRTIFYFDDSESKQNIKRQK